MSASPKYPPFSRNFSHKFPPVTQLHRFSHQHPQKGFADHWDKSHTDKRLRNPKIRPRSTGTLHVPAWRSPKKTLPAAVKHVLTSGLTFVDTASHSTRIEHPGEPMEEPDDPCSIILMTPFILCILSIRRIKRVRIRQYGFTHFSHGLETGCPRLLSVTYGP